MTSPYETVYMICQSLLSWKKKKKKISLPSVECAEGVVKYIVKLYHVSCNRCIVHCTVRYVLRV